MKVSFQAILFIIERDRFFNARGLLIYERDRSYQCKKSINLWERKVFSMQVIDSYKWMSRSFKNKCAGYDFKILIYYQ